MLYIDVIHDKDVPSGASFYIKQRRSDDMKINILGTEYKIKETTEEKDKRLIGNDALCDKYTKEILLDTVLNNTIKADTKAPYLYKKHVLRHELIHAIFFESGLDKQCNDEQLVDFIALQYPKIAKIFKKLNIED